MITVEVTETGATLSKVASNMPKLGKTMLKKAVGYSKTRAEQLTPVRTGLMKQSWYVTSQGDLEGTLSNRAPYFLFFIEGTAPHQIRPKFASALRLELIDIDREKTTIIQNLLLRVIDTSHPPDFPLMKKEPIDERFVVVFSFNPADEERSYERAFMNISQGKAAIYVRPS